jgi:DNA-binding GntR family transcriptional regulator
VTTTAAVPEGLGPEAPERQSDRAYRLLKRSILSLDLAPGVVLVEPELMQRFGVGRTPLREALQRLSTDGLVTTLPRRGTFVSPVTANDVHAVYELRCNLDAFAARLAAERAGEAEIARMEALLEAAASAAPDEAVGFDEQMHALILAATRNDYLIDTLNRLYALSVRLFNLRRYQRETLRDMRAELGAVVAAIRRRDPNAAAAAALAHVTTRGWFPGVNAPADNDTTV